eukprot:COSAG03_NODE_212_length_10585_cov_5.608812_10_plen_78_part_00
MGVAPARSGSSLPPALKDIKMAMAPLMHGCIPVYRKTEEDWGALGEYSFDLPLVDALSTFFYLKKSEEKSLNAKNLK